MTDSGDTLQVAATFDDVIDLHRTDADGFVSTLTGPEDTKNSQTVYGGQVAAQALRAAGLTVDTDRAPHSMHCYFVHPGNNSQPVRFRVERDRDGRGFSSRRVTALQNDQVLCTLSASFCSERGEGWRDQGVSAPAVLAPMESTPIGLGSLIWFEGRDTGYAPSHMVRAPRYWTRSRDPLPLNPLTQACALVYVSDVAAGSPAVPDGSAAPDASLDHAMWFHEPVDVSEWLLVDLAHVTTGRGRTCFEGQIYSEQGQLVASLYKEELFR
ncbi:thioesterase family protein [Rhodococcus pyridinivorans]|uniref:acyl-CoA thioesterase n=1 Tax=Rhodococcus pyridinivorans TaxID=103816 RepID=UPI001E471AB1|nr:acyl-CoA thioesterase domain-containing protein [Rhodococcus pyridinivorans]MCD5422851.1 thioesterase family protein [Rhodococcus pyridinivorans]